MASQVLSFVGWSFLPDFFTTNLQTFYYAVTIRAGSPKPQPGSPVWLAHRRRIYTIVIVTYLLYTLYEADWEIRRAKDFYQLLGVPHDVDDKSLQSRFRKLTLIHHPDKVSTNDNAVHAAAETYYVNLKLARDTLLDPAKRFAYDRFGPDITNWRHCTTIRDFVQSGLRSVAGYYVGSAIFILVFGAIGLFEFGRYWRHLTFLALLAFELHTITRPTPPPLASKVLNPLLATLTANTHAPYLPFQTLQLAHKASIAIFIAVGRLGPTIDAALAASHAGTGPGAGMPPQDSPAGLEARLAKLEHMTDVALAEAQRAGVLEVVPFQLGRNTDGSDIDEDIAQVSGPGMSRARVPGMNVLRGKLRDWFVQNTIRQDQGVRTAVDRMVAARKESRGAGEVGGGD